MRRLADDKADFLPRHVGFRPFFHAERHDAQGAERALHARHGQSGGLDADVIRARRAAANPNPFALLHRAVIGRAIGDGEIEFVFALKRLDFMLILKPLIQNFQHAEAERLGAKHAAVEQHVRRNNRLACGGFLRREELRQMVRDAGVGLEWQADFLEAGRKTFLRLRVERTGREKARHQD